MISRTFTVTVSGEASEWVTDSDIFIALLQAHLGEDISWTVRRAV